MPELSIELCRARQSRLRDALQNLNAERAILTSPENVQWLTGFRPHHWMSATVCLEPNGECVLIAPNEEPEKHAADRVITFEAQWLCTLRQDQMAAIAEQLPESTVPTAIEFSNTGPHIRHKAGEQIVNLEPAILKLRRNKDEDELALMRKAIDCTDAMYRKAREIIEPGINELEVFNQLQAAAVETAGEPLSAQLGNDYRSNCPGGPPRDRLAQEGELIILDLGPAYRGYHADNCRTFSVGGNPTDEQLRAHSVVTSVLNEVSKVAGPGVSCSAFYQQAKEMLDAHLPDAFPHHLGHGVGLYPHEAPHLNSSWNDVFEEGDVFTVEPGVYTDELRAGIRIEENYRVTADGVEQLTSIPTDL